jgi:polyisoprenoid-binding protein YceI
MTSRTQDGAGLADLLPGDDPALLPGPDRIELPRHRRPRRQPGQQHPERTVTTTSRVDLAAGRWMVDPAQSTAVFRVANLGRTVTGTMPITEGTADTDGSGQPAAITGSLNLGAIDAGNARRDKDLRKPKLLDLDRHPAMTFAADTITATPAGWQVTGHLTARGTSVRLAGDAAPSVSGHPES